ncbi:hypothetical protein [Nocardia sp. NPDC050710]|uniref:hypothetical protein n=1 Tax=Nocardia sp. NPDC050710 TaxID=3157220 RepID=UPI0033D35A47
MAQLRAVLAILRIDPDGFRIDGNGAADRDRDVEQAALVGLLYGLFDGQLRQAIAAGARDDAVRVALSSSRILGGRNQIEQAGFDAQRLQDRINVLAEGSTAQPVPVLLDAAAHAAAAAEALLLLTRDPHGADSETHWQTALADLAGAYHLANDEHAGQANIRTQPLR